MLAAHLGDMFHTERVHLDNLGFGEKRAIVSWPGVTVKLHPAGSACWWALDYRHSLPTWVGPARDDAGAPVVAGQFSRSEVGGLWLIFWP